MKMQLKVVKSKCKEQDGNAHEAVLEIVLHTLSTSFFLGKNEVLDFFTQRQVYIHIYIYMYIHSLYIFVYSAFHTQRNHNVQYKIKAR